MANLTIAQLISKGYLIAHKGIYIAKAQYSIIVDGGPFISAKPTKRGYIIKHLNNGLYGNERTASFAAGAKRAIYANVFKYMAI